MKILAAKLKRLYLYRQVVRDMTIKEFKGKYSGTSLGIFLAVIIPLVLAAAISFIFSIIFKANIPNFSLFVLSAILPWMFFSASLAEATDSIINNVSILKQFALPIEILPISVIFANFINFLFGFAVILPLFFLPQLKVLKVLPFLFFPLASQLLFVMGLGLLLSSLNVFFRDLHHLIPISLMFWFWVTPIFYNLKMIPDSFKWILFLNPLTYYVMLYRQILFEARTPGIAGIFLAFLIGAGTFIIGYFVFAKNESMVLKRL